MSEDKPTFTKEELEQIDKDLTTAREKLVSKETQSEIDKARGQAKEEAKKEFELQRKLEDLEREKKELEARVQKSEEVSSAELDNFKKRLDELTESKATIAEQNPFKQKQQKTPENMTDEEISEIERESGIAFFGEEFARDI